MFEAMAKIVMLCNKENVTKEDLKEIKKLAVSVLDSPTPRKKSKKHLCSCGGVLSLSSLGTENGTIGYCLCDNCGFGVATTNYQHSENDFWFDSRDKAKRKALEIYRQLEQDKEHVPAEWRDNLNCDATWSLRNQREL